MQIESLLNGTSSVRHFDASRLRSKSAARSYFDAIEESNTSEELPLAQENSSGGGGSSSSNIAKGHLPSLVRQPSFPKHKRRFSHGANRFGKALKRLSNGPSHTSIERQQPHQDVRSESSFCLLEDPTQAPSAAALADQERQRAKSFDFPRMPSYPPATIFGNHDDEHHDAHIAAAVQALAAGPSRRTHREAPPLHNVNTAEVLRAVAQQDGNNVCAECAADNPRWASWNLGIFICLECSGVFYADPHVMKRSQI